MAKSFLQPDGTRCYVGINCRRHSNINQEILHSWAEEIKQQIESLDSNTQIIVQENDYAAKSITEQVNKINKISELFSTETEMYYNSGNETFLYTPEELQEKQEKIDNEIDYSLSFYFNFSNNDIEEYKPYLETILKSNKKHFERESVHYRVYQSTQTGKMITICVQWFDYYDYDSERMIGEHYFENEEEAEEAADFLNNKIFKL